MTSLFDRIMEIGSIIVFSVVSFTLTVFHNGVMKNIYLGDTQKQRWYYWAYLILFSVVFLFALYPSVTMLYRTINYKSGMWSKFSTTLLFVGLLILYGLHMTVMKYANDARVPPKDVPQKKGPLGDDGAPKQLDNTMPSWIYWFYVAIMGVVSVLGFRLLWVANRAHRLFNPYKGLLLLVPFIFVFGMQIYHLIIINDIYAEPIPPKESRVGGKYNVYAIMSYITVFFVAVFVLQKTRWLRSVWRRVKMEPKYNPLYDKDPTQPVNAQHMYIHQNQVPPESIYVKQGDQI